MLSAERPHLLTVRCNDEEKHLIERAAQRQQMSLSEYVRSCARFEAVSEGDFQMVLQFLRLARARIAGRRKNCRRQGVAHSAK